MMIAILLAASLNLAGVFPPEVKTVGVVMPASVLNKVKFDEVHAALTNAGYRVRLASGLSFGQCASAADRARDLEEVWLDPKVDLVLCARGGTGTADVIKHLDWDRLRAMPDRKVLGFSNITWLLNMMLKKEVGHPISGSSMQHFTYMGGDTAKWLSRCLAGENLPPKRLCALKAGAFSGLPCGGHLHAVQHGMRQNALPEPEGRILFLEASAYADEAGISKSLDEIAHSKWLKGVRGVVFGTLLIRGGKPEDAEQLKAVFASKSPVPVYDGYEYGHVPVLHAIDFRRRVSVAEDGLMTWGQAAATVELVSPTNGAIVAIVPAAQKKVIALPTLTERIRLFADDRTHGGKVLRHDAYWRKAKPLRLKWKVPQHGKWAAKVEIGKKPDLSDARVWYVRANKVDAISGREKTDGGSGGMKEYTVPYANLEVARRYFWRVTLRKRCKKYDCGTRCPCVESKVVLSSPVASFTTEDQAPRWISVEGRVGNMRDLGGWRTQDGRRVRQGMVFRSAGLNDNSVTGEAQGRNRLTVEDIKYMAGTLGIRSDLDLRSVKETADLAESPLGQGVVFVQNPSFCYTGIFRDEGKKAMAANFRHFCDRRNYPVIMHCIGGADRTGSLAYVLNGVLGVARHDLEVDWESTFYPNIPDANPDPHYWCRESHFNDGFSKYGKEGDSWTRRIELYLLDCGVTEAEIATFRDIMLESADEK